jgi:hypothetical protein
MAKIIVKFTSKGYFNLYPILLNIVTPFYSLNRKAGITSLRQKRPARAGQRKKLFVSHHAAAIPHTFLEFRFNFFPLLVILDD